MGEKKVISTRELHSAYKEGKNVIQLLNSGNTHEYNQANKLKYIEKAYDLQAGSYVKAMKDPNHALLKRKKCAEMAEIVGNFISSPKSFLKAGVGEAVTLVPFLDSYKSDVESVYGFDISWSRISHARKFLDENSFNNVQLCTGTLQQIPFMDDSFEVIMTSHACEPNGGFEKIILSELKRVSSNIVALFEPGFEFANKKSQERMIKHGYVKGLPEIAISLGFKILYHAPLKTTVRPENPTAALILQVPNVRKNNQTHDYACPITKKKLLKYDTGYFSNESYLYYPSINNMPTLREENGILASHISEELLKD